MKTILVTGGNRGIGLAIVKGLSKSIGGKILLGCRDLEVGKKVALEIGEKVIAVKLDLSNRSQLKNDLDNIIKNHGNIEGLVNNAGVINRSDFLNESVEEFDAILRVNTLAPFEIIKTVLPSMVENNFGRIVNVSSGFGSFSEGLEGPFSYSLSKAALNAVTVKASRNLPSNVKINSICPGWVRTDMGGEEAPRSPEKGAETVIWLMNQKEDSETGKFYRDKEVISW